MYSFDNMYKKEWKRGERVKQGKTKERGKGWNSYKWVTHSNEEERESEGQFV